MHFAKSAKRRIRNVFHRSKKKREVGKFNISDFYHGAKIIFLNGNRKP
jgi:ATP-dependent exoDNAse (exonuclease V) alpha subunit